MQSRSRKPGTQKLAATNQRTFLTFLLMEQFAAEEIGARIQQARKERGLTQEELAGMASFSKRSLQDYESGLTIPYRHLRELGRLLKKRPEWFLYGDEAEADPSELAEVRRGLAHVQEMKEATERIEALLHELVDDPPKQRAEA